MTKGDRIRELRKAKRITQEEMAQMLSTTKQTISKYEKGIVTNIPSDKIEAMAKALETTPEYILGWDLIVDKDRDQTAEEKETPTVDGGLPENVRMLVEFAKSVPEDKAEMILRVIRSIVEAD